MITQTFAQTASIDLTGTPDHKRIVTHDMDEGWLAEGYTKKDGPGWLQVLDAGKDMTRGFFR